MRYIKVIWNHHLTDEPVLLYSELDATRCETRKVEEFRGGEVGYAHATASVGSTRLGVEPVPSLEEISLQAEFVPFEIDRDEFEAVWQRVQNAKIG